MAKKSSSKTKPAPKPEPTAPPEAEVSVVVSTPSRVARVRRHVFRPKWLLLLALVLLGAFTGPQLAERLPDLTERDEYRLLPENVTLNELPHWVPHDLIRQVAQAEEWRTKPLSLLDECGGQTIAEGFARHPWIKQVIQVRTLPGGRVEVEATYRRPVAMVEVADGKYYPIDADSILLPPADFSRADLKRYPHVVCLSSVPQGPAGWPWGDLLVLGAARLAEQLMHPHDEKSSHWEHLKLAGIVLPKRTTAELDIEDVTYQLLTQDGSQILWGRAPGTGHPGELTAEQKIGRLTQYLADFGTFRPASGPLEIDIRHWQEITQRRLSALESASRR